MHNRFWRITKGITLVCCCCYALRIKWCIIWWRYLHFLITICVFIFQSVKQSSRYESFESFWPLVLYHVSFFIFITTIGLNIIFGIIVDTFSELRDLKVNFDLICIFILIYHIFYWNNAEFACVMKA